ncbi:Hypothetical protein GbCGDNIH9_8495 [Granulibacter bethesdensis]|uniref:Uncharacterized protein n=1 Tax=Granulibacter bethesdensis TaxID=364410 RepID=A0AAC9P8N1_9PROT|nr:Hypothetical protein GbCGDNIH9_8495 [Granulibacter bethesdensis]APH61950.1 Hypothetical protein GbCGDNIH8_8495 [Granulibacter bethesdensis]
MGRRTMGLGLGRRYVGTGLVVVTLPGLKSPNLHDPICIGGPTPS